MGPEGWLELADRVRYLHGRGILGVTKEEGDNIVEALRLAAKPAEEGMRETIVAAMSSHFKSVIEESSRQPFAETDVHLPVKAFEGYADAICKALSTTGESKR